MVRCLFFQNLLVFSLLVITACGGGGSSNNGSNDPSEPAFDASTASGTVDHPLYTLTPGSRQTYTGETEDGTETVDIFVSHETRTVLGIACTVVIDRVYLEGELVEETFDWYAQDSEGNVWYLGEDSTEYDNGVAVSKEGSWEAGVDGAEPGIIMKQILVVGDSYRQEYYAGVAEDMAQIAALNVPVTLSDNSTYTCVKIKEWTPLLPGVVEYKYYAENVGLVLEETEDGSEQSELSAATIDTQPDIDPNDFITVIDNPYLPLTPGTTYTYEGVTEDGTETAVIYVSHNTKEILGISCIVVEDRVYLDGELIEETYDWYAQDVEGNVWYLGEDSSAYENGVLVSTAGSWEAGVDGAQPGIVMKADPRVGDSYRQEYYAGEAEDMAAVNALGEAVTVVQGDYAHCLKTREWTPLDPETNEYKYYASGIGVVLETQADGSEPIELISITTE